MDSHIDSFLSEESLKNHLKFLSRKKEMSSSSSSQCDASEYFEIRPHEGIRVSDNYTWIHPPIPKPNSRLILVGASCCGKTNSC